MEVELSCEDFKAFKGVFNGNNDIYIDMIRKIWVYRHLNKVHLHLTS